MSYPRPRCAECPICGKVTRIHYYHAGYGSFACCGRSHHVLHNSSTGYFAVTAGDLVPADSRVIIRGDGHASLCHFYPDGRYPSHYEVIGELPDIPVYIAEAGCTACGGRGETRVGGFVPCACLKPHTGAWNRETGEMAEQMVESGIPTDGYCSILSDSAQRSGPWARRSRD